MKILGKTKKTKIDKDFLEISFSELLSITGGVIGGTFLANLISDDLAIISGLFILFPGLLEMHGNIYGSLSARLGNMLLLGKLNDKKELKKFVRENLIAVFFLVLVISFILGLISYVFLYFFFNIQDYLIILISVSSALLSSILEIPITVYTTIWAFKHNLDPEDVMGPYVTTIADIVSIFSIIAAVKLLL